MPDWVFEYLSKEGGALKGAPIASVLLVVIGLFGGYMFESKLTSEHIATLDTMIRERDGKIDGLEKTISSRLDKVEKALSDQQISSIKANIKTAPASVDIGGGHPDKQDPRVDQLKNVFRDSGWSVGTAQSQSATTDLLLRAPDLKTSTTIENALKDAGVTYQTAKPPTTGGTDFLLGPAK
jgi:hypothetical protein